MAAPNTVTNYTLGRGKLLFKEDGQAAFADLGNGPSFAITVTLENIEHRESRGGLKSKDLDIVTQLDAAGTLTLDEAKIENLKRFFMAGSISSALQSSGSATDEAHTALHDLWIELGKVSISAVKVTDNGAVVTFTNGTDKVNLAAHTFSEGDIVEFSNSGGALPAEISADTTYYVRNPGAGDFEISIAPTGSILDFTDDGTGTSSVHELFVEGTDYDIDYGGGLLYARSEGAIGASETVQVTYAYAEQDVKDVRAGSTTTIFGELFFVGDPAHGRILDARGRVSLKPDGEFPMIGDEITEFTFNAEFLKVAGVSGLVQIIDRGVVS
jgi:hypothetical protein